jgi:CBS domain-containing protein
MKVQDAMNRELITVRETDSVMTTLKRLVTGEISGAPVVSEDGRLLGLVTEFDLLLAIDFVGEQVPVSRVMTSDVVSITPDLDLDKARDLFVRNNWRRLPVVEGDRVVGILSRRDILRSHFGL